MLKHEKLKSVGPNIFYSKIQAYISKFLLKTANTY